MVKEHVFSQILVDDQLYTIATIICFYVYIQHLKEEVFYQTERENHLQVEYSNLMMTRNNLLQLIKEYELSEVTEAEPGPF